MISGPPVVHPLTAPPNAAERTGDDIATFPRTISNCSVTPRPVLPTTPAEWHSSTITSASYFSANSQILSIGATLPSIEKTPSVAIMRKRCAWAACNCFSRSAISAFA